jgi:hypothetical protein
VHTCDHRLSGGSTGCGTYATPVAGIRVVTFEEVCKAGQVKEVEPIVPDADALAIIMCARQDTNDSTINPWLALTTEVEEPT